MQIQDWIDATLFNFMIDRAATFQLTEYTKGSYLPLARANDVILKEEEGHKNFGEACLEKMCQDPATRAEIQRRFKKWFVASMRIFGRAGTRGNQYCLKVGLKTRDSGDVAAGYIDSIRPVMARCGLRFPDRSELAIELPPQVDLTVPAHAVRDHDPRVPPDSGPAEPRLLGCRPPRGRGAGLASPCDPRHDLPLRRSPAPVQSRRNACARSASRAATEFAEAGHQPRRDAGLPGAVKIGAVAMPTSPLLRETELRAI